LNAAGLRRRLLDAILYVAIGVGLVGGVIWLAADDARKPLADLIWKWTPIVIQTAASFGFAVAAHRPRKHGRRFVLVVGGLLLSQVLAIAWIPFLQNWRNAWLPLSIPVEVLGLALILTWLAFPPRQRG